MEAENGYGKTKFQKYADEDQLDITVFIFFWDIKVE